MSDARTPMTDDELAKWLGIAGTKQCAAIMAAMTAEERAEHEAFAAVEAEIILWDKGLGPLPSGVIVCNRK